MKIICEKNKLINSINIVLKAISSKTTMPILKCLIIQVKSDTIKLIANDMEIGIETILEGNIIEPGTIALNAKVFSEIVRKLSNSDITIETDENHKTTILSDKSKFNIYGLSAEEFPYLPNIEKKNPIVLSQFSLKEVIRQTVFSISDNNNSKVMLGELFEINDNNLKVVSLDGHRISIRNIQLTDNYEDIKAIVPGKTLIEISKILSGEVSDEVRLFFTDKHILFEFDQTIVLSRLIDGEYFNINQMFSEDYETMVNINKNEILSCIDRSTLLVNENDKKPIIFDVSDNKIEFKMNTSIGSMKEEIDVNKSGKDMLIGFNPKFLLDALRVIDDETIDIYLINPKAPCFIKDKEESYMYLILPVNFNATVY
jgi:DNA polymerase III subunit beta